MATATSSTELSTAKDASVPLLLISANVGSVFEDPSRLLKPWIDEFLATVTRLRPSFIALHMQEVGGKTYEKSMEYVQDFIKQLCEAQQLVEYNRIRIYLDEDYNSAEHFTALGNLYFALNTVQVLRMWNFMTHDWETVTDKLIHTGNIESVASKEKAKFPQHFFPECRWSRKGFLRTRWNVEGTVVDMVNIHLFHDASNLEACEEFPSVYCKSRRRALIHTLDRFQRDAENVPAPYFVFGDFNFRCDTEGVVKKLTEDLTIHQIPGNVPAASESVKLVEYKTADGSTVLSVGKKEFSHAEHQTKFKEDWLRKFDRELDPLREILFEFPISFPPSYPFEEDPTLPQDYMSSRCPAWCDRILMNPAAKGLMVEKEVDEVEYKMIGSDVCMGDHKPILLSFHLRTNQGTRSCSCVASSVHEPPSGVAVLTSCSSRPSRSSSDGESSSNKLDIIRVRGGGTGGDDSDKENSICNGKLGGDWIGNGTTYEETNNRDRDKKLNGCAVKMEKIGNNINEFEGCANCLNRFEAALRRIEPSLGFLDPRICCEKEKKPNQLSKRKQRDLAPLQISINVVDPDNNNLNVCMCPVINSGENQDQVDEVLKGGVVELNQSGNRICAQCRNIINQQPMEHRRALISQRLTMANDIIVNRIDSQFLSTMNGSRGKGSNFEPYTPDSMESHSPMLSGLDGGMQSSSSSSSFTTTTTTTTSGGSGGGGRGEREDEGVEDRTATKSSSLSSGRGSNRTADDVDLIERDEQEGKLGQCAIEEGEKKNQRPELQTMNSVEMEKDRLGGKIVSGINNGAVSSPGVNANQLKSRLERLQILSKMPRHAIRNKGFGGREEFEDQMRRREEKKEMKEIKRGMKRGKKTVLCCYRDEEGEKGSNGGGQCLVM